MKKIFSIAVVVALLIAAVALSSLNAGSVELNLYWFQWSLPLGFLLLLFAVCGLFIGLFLAAIWWLWPVKKECTHWRREFNLLNDKYSESVAQVSQEKDQQLP